MNAAAKSLQSSLTLCDPIDGSPPGSPIPGILQARTLEWVAISFSNAGKWKVKVKSLTRVQLFKTPWTAAYQAPPSMGFSRQEFWSGLPSPSPFYWIVILKATTPPCILFHNVKAISLNIISVSLFSNRYWMFQFSSGQSLNCFQLFATSWTAACQASLPITNSRRILKLIYIKLVIPSNHLVLCPPRLLLPSVFPIRVFSNESALRIRWPKY